MGTHHRRGHRHDHGHPHHEHHEHDHEHGHPGHAHDGHGHDHDHDAHDKGVRLNLIQLASIALAIAAATKELRKPPGERTWHGTVAGFVPYEFRVPTLSRVRERLWDPHAEHLVGPQVFGVGWSVNAGRLVEIVRERVQAAR